MKLIFSGLTGITDRAMIIACNKKKPLCRRPAFLHLVIIHYYAEFEVCMNTFLRRRYSAVKFPTYRHFSFPTIFPLNIVFITLIEAVSYTSCLNEEETASTIVIVSISEGNNRIWKVSASESLFTGILNTEN